MSAGTGLALVNAGLLLSTVLLFLTARGNAPRHLSACLAAVGTQLLAVLVAALGVLTSRDASLDKWVLLFVVDVVYLLAVLARLTFLLGIVDKTRGQR